MTDGSITMAGGNQNLINITGHNALSIHSEGVSMTLFSISNVLTSLLVTLYTVIVIALITVYIVNIFN
jgi:hypothetical protein